MIRPFFIFEITPECDLDCIYCYNVWKEKTEYQKRTLDVPKIKQLFTKITDETAIDSLVITGGEPLLYENLIELVSFFKEKRIKTGITTHGIHLTDQKTKELIDAGISYFEISLDSLNPAIYQKLTNDNRLDKVKKAILNIKKHNALLTVSTIITKLNIQDIPDVIDFSFAFSADFLSLNRFIPGGKGLKNKDILAPDINELKNILEIANKKAQETKMQINISVPIEDCIIRHKNYPFLKFGTCMCGAKKWLIDSVGNLRTCEQNPDIIGNLFDSNFTDLANSEQVKQFRNQNLNQNCNNCMSYLHCGGGCRFINRNY